MPRSTRRRKTRQAAGHPAVPVGEDDKTYTHPAWQADPGMHDYENGDTSSWAEDPSKAPYSTLTHPNVPTEESDHPAADKINHALLKKASKCIELAEMRLGKQASVAKIERLAVKLMDLKKGRIASMLRNASEARAPEVAPRARKVAKKKVTAEDRMLAEMLREDAATKKAAKKKKVAKKKVTAEDRMLAEMLREEGGQKRRAFEQMSMEDEEAMFEAMDDDVMGGGWDDEDDGWDDEDDGMYAMEEDAGCDDFFGGDEEDDFDEDGDDDEAMMYGMVLGEDEDDFDDEDDDEEAMLMAMMGRMAAEEEEEEEEEDDSDEDEEEEEDEEEDDDEDDDDSDDDEGDDDKGKGKKKTASWYAESDIDMMPTDDDPMGLTASFDNDPVLDQLYERHSKKASKTASAKKSSTRRKKASKTASAKKSRKTASKTAQRPKSRKKSAGAQSLGNVSRQAGSTVQNELSDLQNLWDTDPDVSDVFR